LCMCACPMHPCCHLQEHQRSSPSCCSLQPATSKPSATDASMAYVGIPAQLHQSSASMISPCHMQIINHLHADHGMLYAFAVMGMDRSGRRAEPRYMQWQQQGQWHAEGWQRGSWARASSHGDATACSRKWHHYHCHYQPARPLSPPSLMSVPAFDMLLCQLWVHWPQAAME
jgi:hypothetical protein